MEEWITTSGLGLVRERTFFLCPIGGPAGHEKIMIEPSSFIAITCKEQQPVLGWGMSLGKSAERYGRCFMALSAPNLFIDSANGNICRSWERGHGKGKDSYIYPREDTISMITDYLAIRGSMDKDDQGEPLFASIDKGGTPRHRLSRIGLNGIVDGHLGSIGTKRHGMSCHALRHTCGHLIYRETKDLRVVQEVLRHNSPVTSAKYADIEQKKNRHTKSIRIHIDRRGTI